MRIVTYVLTALLLVPIGYGLKWAIDAGYAWTIPIWIAGCLGAGYAVGDDADRDDYRARWSALKRRIGR